jgi:putative radical SAM enzyme (TIGR03279 family)
LQTGDHLVAINGHPLRDVIDVQVTAAEPTLDLQYRRDGTTQMCHVERVYGESLGLSFTNPIFDGPIRVCQNHCDFCFVDQMAPDLRDALYLKDDDYRLSFLQGSYITLTNLTEADWARIEAQFLSPLYLSIHATEPEVRIGLMHNPQAGSILAQIDRLAEIGIEMHTQAVLVPKRNDSSHLDRTIADLQARYPAVRELSVVPVGLTRYHPGSLRPYTDTEAAEVLAQLQTWQARLEEELGTRFVYPSDEWYLRAGRPVPPLDAYGGVLHHVIENGVGMVARFEAGRPSLIETLADLGGATQTWVTGTLFADRLAGAADAMERERGIEVEVVPVTNRRFGETVTVAGLLTVTDIVRALEAVDVGDRVVVPDAMFRGPEGRALDGKTVEALAEAVNRPVIRIAQTGTTEWKIDPEHEPS